MDVFGKALINYYQHQSESTLWLHNSYGQVEEMPVDVFFRGIHEMPDLELIALSQCSGKILDIGAGVGSHALILQEKGLDVTALEISTTACQIMKLRGVKKIINQDIFTFRDEKFDTLLLLMNGIGLSESISGLRYFLQHVKTLLNPEGKLIFDSSDISYLYFGETLPTDKYYGQIAYQYEYAGEKGDWFNWLYVDNQLLKQVAAEEGWELELIYEDDMDQFLVSMTLK
ncbi:MAG TPA: methyltransferase domain-containing protein [Daejeonella sp.]|nr:methyltransferase domain-containing protein [Daejeonella sp.]